MPGRRIKICISICYLPFNNGANDSKLWQIIPQFWQYWNVRTGFWMTFFLLFYLEILKKRFVLTRATYGINILLGLCSYKTVMCFMRAWMRMLWILTSAIVPWVTLPWMHYSSGPALPLRVTLTQGKSDPVPAQRASHTAKAPACSLQRSANEQLRGGIRAEEERRRQGNRLPSLRPRSYCGFLDSALQGFQLVLGSFLQPTIRVCLL